MAVAFILPKITQLKNSHLPGLVMSDSVSFVSTYRRNGRSSVTLKPTRVPAVYRGPQTAVTNSNRVLVLIYKLQKHENSADLYGDY